LTEAGQKRPTGLPVNPNDGTTHILIEPPSTPKHAAINWPRRLKRVFGIEIKDCARCGGKLKIIASIEKP
jgi:hypothetical protein